MFQSRAPRTWHATHDVLEDEVEQAEIFNCIGLDDRRTELVDRCSTASRTGLGSGIDRGNRGCTEAPIAPINTWRLA